MQIEFRLAISMLDDLEQLNFMKDTPNLKETQAWEVLGILFEGTSSLNPPNTVTEALQLYSLAAQILCLGFQSYSQAHVDSLEPFFLDTSVSKVRLLGI